MTAMTRRAQGIRSVRVYEQDWTDDERSAANELLSAASCATVELEHDGGTSRIEARFSAGKLGVVVTRERRE
jgi:hypothetical protein